MALPFAVLQSAVVLLLFLFPSMTARAADPTAPAARHLGVATCAGSACHGATKAGRHAVRQDEYFLWRERGGDQRHSRSFDVLREPRAKRIAANLGLSVPPHETDQCLDCHADNVAVNLRGPKFQLEDGVGCEACHGGSERWLKPHDTGLPHAENVKLGMVPTDDPARRAELCLSCHFGNERKFVDHRLIGAGHPRQSFELVVFTDLQGHHDVDADYTRRGKVAADLLAEWAVGQAVAVREVLEALLDPQRSSIGLWPEFVLFDCHACHHATSETRWRPRPSTGLGPGLARLNDASFLMLRQALEALEPAAASTFRDDLRALHAAVSAGKGNPQQVARRILGQVNAWLPKLVAWRVSEEAERAMSLRVLREGAAGEYRDYAGAEQASSLLQILMAAREGDWPAEKRMQARRLEDQMLAAVADADRFAPAAFEETLGKLEKLLQ